jgi:translation initiation factor IF-3
VRTQTGPRVNRQIRAPEVRLIDEEGSQLGVVPIQQALDLAQERALDLVEVAANAVPPVCKLVDFGRYKYEQTKREREAKKHQHATEVKELRLRPTTDPHDLDVRARAARKFLEEGHKVRLLVRFRGRESQHPDIARGQIDQIVRAVSDVGFVEQGPAFEGRAMFAVLAKGSAPRREARPSGLPTAGQPTAPPPGGGTPTAPHPAAPPMAPPTPQAAEAASAPEPAASVSEPAAE